LKRQWERRRHTSAYVSIRQHTSAYVSIRQHTSAYVSILQRLLKRQWEWRRHTSAYVSIRQHTSAYVKEAVGEEAYRAERPVRRTHVHPATCACVSIRQHTSAYISIRQHTSAYVSICQHTSAYVHAATCAACAAACRHVECELPFPLPQREPRLHLRFFKKKIKIAPERTQTSHVLFAFGGAALIKNCSLSTWNYFFI
jgi:hypothetical protein